MGTLNGITELTIAGVGIIPVKNYTTGVFEIGRKNWKNSGALYPQAVQAKARPCGLPHAITAIHDPDGGTL